MFESRFKPALILAPLLFCAFGADCETGSTEMLGPQAGPPQP